MPAFQRTHKLHNDMIDVSHFARDRMTSPLNCRQAACDGTVYTPYGIGPCTAAPIQTRDCHDERACLQLCDSLLRTAEPAPTCLLRADPCATASLIAFPISTASMLAFPAWQQPPQPQTSKTPRLVSPSGSPGTEVCRCLTTATAICLSTTQAPLASDH